MRSIKKAIAIGAFSADDEIRMRNIFLDNPFELVPTVFLAAEAETVDMLVTDRPFDHDILKLSGLKWIHTLMAGMDSYAIPEILNRKIIVTSSAGRSAPALAEHAFYFMMSLNYHSMEWYEAQKSKTWGIANRHSLTSLSGKTLGIIGFGNTGRELARKAKAFDMKVVVYRRTDTWAADVDTVYSADKGECIYPLLESSDFVVMAVSLNDETYHMINQSAFRHMKPTACLINLARGSVVDEEALIDALYNKTIAGAGLDTFETEPLRKDSRLWEAPNTLITSHYTPAMADKNERQFYYLAENVSRYLNGQELLNRLTDKDLYTKQNR